MPASGPSPRRLPCRRPQSVTSFSRPSASSHERSGNAIMSFYTALRPSAFGAAAARPPSGWVGRQRGASSTGPFPTASHQTGHDTFVIIRLSSDYFRDVAVGRPAWILSWQTVQATNVLRRLFTMIFTHAGFSVRPGLLRSASLRT